MNGYKDTTELADECDRRYRELKEQRDERERQTQYDGLVQEKNRATENDLSNLAKRFREMNGYKNTAELADECDKRYHQLKNAREEQEERERLEQYQQICEATKGATTERDWRLHADQFRAMNGYKNTTKLAEQCDDRSRAAKEQREKRERQEQYQRLCEETKKASTENDWCDLAEHFRAMEGYKNTAELAEQCANRYRQLKERREEQERVEVGKAGGALYRLRHKGHECSVTRNDLLHLARKGSVLPKDLVTTPDGKKVSADTIAGIVFGGK
jgi:hypothetical protein